MGRIALGVGLVIGVSFAVQGGEYGTTDLLRTRRQLAAERQRVDSLEDVVRRLERERRLVESDPETQERIAREEFGMIRGTREILYRFTDSVGVEGGRR